jgi:hypothetical protein
MFKIVSCVFSLLLVASVAAAGSPTASSPLRNASASIPQVCSDQKFACTTECHDLSAGSLAACLRICNHEYQECIAGHQTLTGEDEATSADECDSGTSFDAAVANTSPQVCYDQLQDCVVGCDRDDGSVDLGCTRQCTRIYQKCLGH